MAEDAIGVARDIVRDRRASFLIWGWPALVRVGACVLTILPERIWGDHAGSELAPGSRVGDDPPRGDDRGGLMT